MNLQIFVVSIIVPLVLLALALYTLFKSKRGSQSISFALLCINLTLLTTTNVFLNAPFAENRRFLFELFCFLGVMPLFFLALFFRSFPQKDAYSRYYTWFVSFFIIPYSIFSYLLLSGLWVESVNREGTALIITYANNITAAIGGAIIIAAIILVFIPVGLRLRQSTGTDKTRIRLMVTGLAVSTALGVLTAFLFNFIPTLAVFAWIYPFSFIPFVTTTIYALIKYRFMEIRLALRVIIIKTTLAILIITALFTLYFLNIRLFGSLNVVFGVVQVIVGTTLFVTTYELLIKGLQFVYDNYLFPQLKGKIDRYDELLKVTTESIDLDYISNRVSTITKEMFTLTFSRVVLATDKNFAQTFVDSQGKITVLDELLHKSNPTTDEQQAIKSLTAGSIQLNIPLISHTGVIAVLQLGEKRNNEAFTNDEITLLTSMQRHLGIALENAQLFYELATDKETIKEEHAKLEAVLSNIVDAVAALDAEGTVLFVNKSMLRLIGKQESDLIGQSFDQHISFSYNDQPITRSHFFPETQTDHSPVYSYPEPVELQNTGHQKKYVRITAASLSQSTTPISQILMLHDVTKEIQLETMKLDFVSMAAHELRTPLTSIRGYTEMAQREIADEKRNDEDISTFLERIMINATDLNTLVDNLLNVSQIEQGSLSMHLRPVEITKLIDSLLPDFEALAEARSQDFIYKKSQETLPVVLADKSKIAEVYINIVTNALKYTPAHGKVSLRVWHDEHFIYSAISDNGPGIEADALPYMFTKFFRVQGPLEAGSKGTGLGLYISKSIVTLHGGDIWVESTVGQGSTFTFKLPWSKSTPTPAPEEYTHEPTIKHLIRLKSNE